MSKELQAQEVDLVIQHLTDAIQATIQDRPYALIGIANGGIDLVKILASRLNPSPPFGILNALFHRDDVGHKPIPNNFHPTNIDFPVDDATIILVDDVFASGRTIRAALNEVFDHGRPAEVLLAVLVDAQARKLPLHPDFVGTCMTPAPGNKISVQLNSSHPADYRIEEIPS